MAKMYRRKRTSKAYSLHVDGDVRYYSAYELGHVLWQTDHALPLDPPLHMAQGYKKAAREQDLYNVAEFRRLYRLGLVSPLPRYRYMVQGIRVCIFTLDNKGTYPLNRGQNKRLPILMRQKQAAIDKAYVKRAFK